MKSALILHGGWEGHQPREVAALLAGALGESGYQVSLSDSLDALLDGAALKALDLIVMQYTMSTIRKDQLEPLLAAVRGGVGLAGSHGGMCDAFRDAPEYQFMTGGQWVAHPGNDGRLYRVNIIDRNFATEGIEDFDVRSEKYYMHVDPAVRVLATTTFEEFDHTIMPVAWTKTYGRGRVYYNALGHQANIIAMPPVMAMMQRGMRWAGGEGPLEIGQPFARVYAA